MADALESMLTALYAALMADVTLDPLITGVYSGRADAGAPLNYLVIPDMNTETLGTFRKKSNVDRGELSIRIWARTHLEVSQLYGHVKRILHAKRLVLNDHYQVSGKTRLVTVIPDPADGAGIQGVVSFAWITHVNP